MVGAHSHDLQYGKSTGDDCALPGRDGGMVLSCSDDACSVTVLIECRGNHLHVRHYI